VVFAFYLRHHDVRIVEQCDRARRPMRVEAGELVGKPHRICAIERNIHGCMLPSAGCGMTQDSTDGLRNLERSCRPARASRDWFRVAHDAEGLLRVEADLVRFRYAPHRHDTYAIGITIDGVQSFNYRRERRDCLPGDVIVLHPDEAHDGQAGTENGFRYRMVYLSPREIQEALGSRANALPFLRNGHGQDRRLRRAVHAAIEDLERPIGDIERAGLVGAIADALLELDPTAKRPQSAQMRLRTQAVRRAREMLDAEGAVSAAKLERETDLDRYELARHFRRLLGTSPYRYHQMRRLERARRDLVQGAGIAAVALEHGFADQSHFTRQFKAAYGLPPGEWVRMRVA
jgi:AraC-like DNA-binding protein